MSRFLSSRYARLCPYVPGEQPGDAAYIKLNTNESPYPPAPSVAKAVEGKIDNLKLYPDPLCFMLRESIAASIDTRAENVFVANGSDDILNFAFMLFCGRALFPAVSYGFYRVFAELHDVKYTAVPMGDGLTINYRDYLDARALVVIANPNAPTGRSLPVSEIEEIVKSNPDNVVLIDEAYVDFGGESCVPLTKRYDNLLVVQTFSKSRSMAGARLGFAVGSEELICDLRRLKYSMNPYNINSMTMAAGIAAIREDEYYRNNCLEIIKTREYVTSALQKLDFEVLPSRANFVFVRSERVDGGTLYSELKGRGILVRHFNDAQICDYNRVTIGTREQMEKFIETVKSILNGGEK